MIVEHPRELFWKKVAALGFLIVFIAIILFPLLMVVSISFREGNFSPFMKVIRVSINLI